MFKSILSKIAINILFISLLTLLLCSVQASAQLATNSDKYFSTVNGGVYTTPKQNDSHQVMINGTLTNSEYRVVTGPKHGRVSGVDNWRFAYFPNQNYVGVDFFTYYLTAGAAEEHKSNISIVIIYVGVNINGEVVGDAGCMGVGEPIDTSSGNMYLRQTDYVLPSPGYSNIISRFYNTYNRDVNLFGLGWNTLYDEKLEIIDPLLIRYVASDGRVTFFGRMTTSEPFKALQKDSYSQITQNADGSYNITYKNGNVHKFNSSGKLISLTDLNNNQTTLNYDANDKLSSVTDAVGRVLTFTTNGAGRVTSISDTVGNIATYTYGSSQELLSVTYADNSKYQFTYTTANSMLMLATVKDALDNVLETHQYDSQGRATTSERHGGVEKYTLNYISDTETHVTDALNHVTKYFFDQTKDRTVLTKTEGSCGCGSSLVETRAYDNNLNVTSKINASNQSTNYTYDSNGNVLTMTDAVGTRTFTYNQYGQVLTATNVMNGVTTFTYDTAGNLLTVKDALNNTTSFTYDSRGLPLTITDPLSNVTTLTYNSFGQLIERKDALNNISKFEYDARGRITKATDALNNITNYAYDAVGRIQTIIQPDNKTITFGYDLAGRRTSVTDARGKSTSFSYDGAYRLTSVANAAGKSISNGYDLMSNLTAQTDQLGRTTNFEYDDFNRLVRVIYPEETPGATRLEERTEYDAIGKVIKRIDTAGRATTFSYDAANRLTSTTDPALKETKYEYNALSQMTALVDALNQRYTYVYDALGRVVSQTRNGHTKSFVYDAVGNRTQRTDYNGAVTNYVYDALNRLTTINYPNSTSVSYGYDKLSRLTSATNQNGTVSFSYNNMSRVSSTTDVWGQILNYTYDGNGNRTQLKVGGNNYTTYTYDDLNRLIQLADSAGGLVTYGYDDASRLTSKNLPNGVATTYQYNGLDQLIRLKDAKGTTTIADNQYTYNNAGNITQNIDQAGTHIYNYDLLDRLTSSTYPGINESYAYDAVGNRTSSTMTGSSNYRFMNSPGAGTYTYNKNGNPVSKTTASGVWQYEWDYENRLTKVTLPAGTSVSYKYDALGRRVQRTTSTGEREDFTYDGSDVLLDKLGDGSVVEYLNGPGIDNKIRQKSSSGTHYFVQDHLGSTSALTDVSGNVVERITYSAYGESTGSSLTRYQYTGREHDSLTGLYYYRARWYDAQMGRFISEDPIEFAGGMNWYAYVGNNPVNYADPYGLQDRKSPERTHVTVTVHDAIDATEVDPPTDQSWDSINGNLNYIFPNFVGPTAGIKHHFRNGKIIPYIGGQVGFPPGPGAGYSFGNGDLKEGVELGVSGSIFLSGSISISPDISKYLDILSNEGRIPQFSEFCEVNEPEPGFSDPGISLSATVNIGPKTAKSVLIWGWDIIRPDRRLLSFSDFIRLQRLQSKNPFSIRISPLVPMPQRPKQNK
jgi:RHS repeat-associated protein